MYHHLNKQGNEKVNNNPRTVESSTQGGSVKSDNWRSRANAKPLTVTRKRVSK